MVYAQSKYKFSLFHASTRLSSPLDLDGDNLYEVSGEVSDGQLKTPFNLRIQVLDPDANESIVSNSIQAEAENLNGWSESSCLVISLVLITHGYIILIWDGFMPAWMRTILSGFSRNPLVGFGRIIQHIPTSLSMMTTIRDGFLSSLKANPYATTIFA